MARSIQNGTAEVKSFQQNFLLEHLIKEWNKQPYDVKSSTTVRNFEVNLEKLKQECIEDDGSGNAGHFWRVSTIAFPKIESDGYLKTSGNIMTI